MEVWSAEWVEAAAGCHNPHPRLSQWIFLTPFTSRPQPCWQSIAPALGLGVIQEQLTGDMCLWGKNCNRVLGSDPPRLMGVRAQDVNNLAFPQPTGLVRATLAPPASESPSSGVEEGVKFNLWETTGKQSRVLQNLVDLPRSCGRALTCAG